MSDVIEKNEFMTPKCIENNEPHHLTDQEAKIYSGSALSSLQISQQDPVSLKRDHTGTGSTVKQTHFDKVRPFLSHYISLPIYHILK